EVQTWPSPQEKSSAPTAHSPLGVSARLARLTDVCPGNGRVGSVVQADPLNCSTLLPLATQTRPGAGAAAASRPTFGTLTRRQACPFQRSTSDVSGKSAAPAAHTSAVLRAATAARLLGCAGPAGSGVGKRVQAVPFQWKARAWLAVVESLETVPTAQPSPGPTAAAPSSRAPR